MSPYLHNFLKVQQAKEAVRLRNCLLAADYALKKLRTNGVQAELFGSVARQRVHVDSDVDIIVFNRGDMSNEGILGLAEAAVSELGLSIPIDVVFADEVDELKLHYMLEDRTPVPDERVLEHGH